MLHVLKAPICLIFQSIPNLPPSRSAESGLSYLGRTLERAALSCSSHFRAGLWVASASSLHLLSLRKAPEQVPSPQSPEGTLVWRLPKAFHFSPFPGV